MRYGVMQMTQDEVKRLLTIIVASYPNYKNENMKLTVNVWNEMLQEYSYEEAVLGLKTFIATDTSGFAPSIGQLIGMISKISNVEQLNENEAWSLVRRAIENGAYHSEEEFNKLPELVQKSVGSSSQLFVWATDKDYNEGVVSSHFINTYRIVCKRQEEYSRMPQEAKLRLEALRAQALGQKGVEAIEQREPT